MDKKKLLLVVPKLDQGGLERVCVRTARMMEPYFEVTIAAFDPSDPAYDLTGLRVCDLRAPAAPGKLGKAVNVLRRALRLRALKRKLRADISYSFGPTANRANVAAGGKGKIWCGLRSYMDLEKKRELKLIAGRSDRLICCSAVLAQEAGRLCQYAGTEVLYNPYRAGELLKHASQPDRDIPAEWENCQVLTALGREHDSKGFWHMLKAFSVLHKKLPDARLAIVGAGDFTEYRALAEGLGVTEAVLMPGLKKNPFPWLLRADLYVACSLYEGFPNAMVEAMTLGRPVCVTNCMTGPAEILTDDYESALKAENILEGEYGVLVPPMDPEKNMNPAVITAEEKRLAGEWHRLLTDQKLLKALGEAAGRRAQRYSEDGYIERFLRIAGENEPPGTP